VAKGSAVIVTTEEAEAVMKRCQRGSNNLDNANNLHAECYGTIGALIQDRDRMRDVLIKASNKFAEYADIHASKNPPDEKKAKRNLSYSQQCIDAINGVN